MNWHGEFVTTVVLTEMLQVQERMNPSVSLLENINSRLDAVVATVADLKEGLDICQGAVRDLKESLEFSQKDIDELRPHRGSCLLLTDIADHLLVFCVNSDNAVGHYSRKDPIYVRDKNPKTYPSRKLEGVV